MSTIIITVAEKYSKREFQASDSGDSIYTTEYLIEGTDLETDALQALEDNTSSQISVNNIQLYKQSPSIRQTDNYRWIGEVEYKELGLSSSSSDANSFAFQIGTETRHITQSLETVGSYGAGDNDAPDFKGAIGITPDGIQGVDIIVPTFRFSEQKIISAGSVSMQTLREWAQICGTVNNGTFKTFSKGEVLFLGCSGSRRDGEAYDITFHYAASFSKANFQVGDVDVANKEGWHYLWVLYEDAIDDAKEFIVKRPKAAYVERVYEYGDFGILEVGGVSQYTPGGSWLPGD